jgi:glycosyltransferase involved in cell wall biosynthesis
MRITFVAPFADLGGGIRVISIHADRLRRRGHEVLVVSQPRGRATLREQVRSIVRGRGLIRRPRVESHMDHVDVPHRVMPRWQAVTDADLPDADVVIASWWETAEWVSRLSPSKGAKAYFVQGHEVFEHVPKERAAATYRLALHKITVSSWLSGLMRDLYGDADVSLVPNSVDHALFHASPRGKQPVPTVGFVYSTAPFKGCRTSFEAFALVRRRFPDLRLVAFGTEEPSPELPLPEGTRYVRRPPQDQIRGIYSQCDAWVSGSTSEGFSLPLLEAMACGCPVVSTAVGGALDFLKEGVNGHVVPVGDGEAMADRIVRILALPDPEWRALSDSARATADGYDWDAATTLFEEALRKAIRKAGGNLP